MKYLSFLVMTLMIVVQPVQAIFLQHCSNIGDRFDDNFEFCVNSNFNTIQYSILGNIYLPDCSNWHYDGVSFSFETCLNENFRRVSSILAAYPYLTACYNNDRQRVHFTFVNCVNRNFREIRQYF